MEKNFNSKISIIIPVFNAEVYLEQCLESIKHQTYHHFEVILVNDGSVDHSAGICQEYVKKDSRFRYFEKENGGVSSARNLGLDHAEGEYITFIDADDWVEDNHLEILMNAIVENNCDIAISSYKQFIQTRDVFLINIYSNQEKYLLNVGKMNREKFLAELPKLMFISNSFNCAVSKLFSKRLVEDIRFDTTIIYAEDLDFYFKLYLKGNEFVFVNADTYIYRQHDESTTAEFDQIHAEHEMLVYKNMLDKVSEIGIPTVNYVNILQSLIDSRDNFLKNKELLAEFKRFIDDSKRIQTYPKTLISIIVPIYNVSPYLKQCLESIKNQTYPYFEVILVNDGSTDGSKEICQQFTDIDCRFLYVEQKNEGVSAARNTGILKSKGEYITFIDGDDFVDEKYLEELFIVAMKHNSEIVVGSYKRFNQENNTFLIHVYEYFEKRYEDDELIKSISLVEKEGLEFQTAWGKLFHRRLFKEIMFPVGKIIEDTRTNYKLYLESNRTTYIHKDNYIYRIVDTTLSNQITEKFLEDHLDCLLERVAVLSLIGCDMKEEKINLLDRLDMVYQQAKSSGLENTEIFRRYTEILYLLEKNFFLV